MGITTHAPTTDQVEDYRKITVVGITTEQLDNWFTYHAPTTGQIEDYRKIRDAARSFAEVMLRHTPPSADQAAALRLLREAVMTANASIACGGT